MKEKWSLLILDISFRKLFIHQIWLRARTLSQIMGLKSTATRILIYVKIRTKSDYKYILLTTPVSLSTLRKSPLMKNKTFPPSGSSALQKNIEFKNKDESCLLQYINQIEILFYIS